MFTVILKTFKISLSKTKEVLLHYIVLYKKCKRKQKG